MTDQDELDTIGQRLTPQELRVFNMLRYYNRPSVGVRKLWLHAINHSHKPEYAARRRDKRAQQQHIGPIISHINSKLPNCYGIVPGNYPCTYRLMHADDLR